MEYLKQFVAPSIIIAVMLFIFGQTNGRFDSIDQRITAVDEKIDRQIESVNARVAETNTRIDKALEMLAAAAERDGKNRSDLEYLRNRVDQISEKLDVAAVNPSAIDSGFFVSVPKGPQNDGYNAVLQGNAKFKPDSVPLTDWVRQQEETGSTVYEIVPRKFSVPLSGKQIAPNKETPDK